MPTGALLSHEHSPLSGSVQQQCHRVPYRPWQDKPRALISELDMCPPTPESRANTKCGSDPRRNARRRARNSRPRRLAADNRAEIENPRAMPIWAGGGSFCGDSRYSALDDVETNLGLLSTLPVPSGRQLPCTRWIYAYRAPSTICYKEKYDLRRDLSQACGTATWATAAFAIARRLQFFAIAAVARYARRAVWT